MKKFVLILITCAVFLLFFDIKIHRRHFSKDEIIEKQIESLFRRFDLDNNGILDKEEVKEFVKTITPETED